MVSLLFFNDPLCFSQKDLGKTYQVMQSFFESSFISLLFYFWLLLMHSIANQSNLIAINKVNFFAPKLLICGCIFLYLVWLRIYIYVLYSQDPFFDDVTVILLNDNYLKVKLLGALCIASYAVYFSMITYKVIGTLKQLKKTYRFSIGVTAVTMLVSSVLMLQNGQASQRMDPPLFFSLYTLFNFYVYFIAYIYAPFTDSEQRAQGYDIPQAERERQEIMSSFYETEMNESNDMSAEFDDEALYSRVSTHTPGKSL